MSRPTDAAIQHFAKAANKSYLAATMKDDQQLAWAVNELAAGLWDMAKGLRATYLLLDEVKDIVRPRGASTGSDEGFGTGMGKGLAGRGR